MRWWHGEDLVRLVWSWFLGAARLLLFVVLPVFRFSLVLLVLSGPLPSGSLGSSVSLVFWFLWFLVLWSPFFLLGPFGFSVFFGGPGGSRKLQEAGRINFHLFSYL